LFLRETTASWAALCQADIPAPASGGLAPFAVAKELSLGDIVGASGALFRTKKGKRALRPRTCVC